MSVPYRDWIGPAPPCFNDEDEWKEWHRLNEIAKSGNEHYCADCTPEYARKMRAVDRCIHTTVKFYRINGGITGSSRPYQYDGEAEETTKEKPHPTLSAEAT